MKLSNDKIELMQRLFEIQNDGKATIFIRISGHTQQLEIDIHTPYWIAGAHATYSFNEYIDDDRDAQYLEQQFEKLNQYLNTL